MELLINGKFYNPSRGSLTLPEVLGEMVEYMKEKSQKSYEVIVGCDSSAVEEPTFPVVIVILRKGEGGRFFLKRVKYPTPKKFYNIHDRILEEVLLSCQLALWLRENFESKVLAQKGNLMYKFEYIHADVGQNGVTKDMVKEITGLIRGNGFVPQIKPDSFAASSVADRFA